MDNSNTILDLSKLLEFGQVDEARQLTAQEYPFHPVKKTARQYTIRQKVDVFLRDGFIDRYDGSRLVCTGALLTMSRVLGPAVMPYHRSWKSGSCHRAFWDLTPTIDHIVPVSRGGADDLPNWVTMSFKNNFQKQAYTLEELGWTLRPSGDLGEWDGLCKWMLDYTDSHPGILEDQQILGWVSEGGCPNNCVTGYDVYYLERRTSWPRDGRRIRLTSCSPT